MDTIPLNKPRVVALVGPRAAGKTSCARYLAEQHGVQTIEIGAFARKLAEEAGSDQPHLRHDVADKQLGEYGPGYVMLQLVADLVENNRQRTSALVITGIRTPAEAALLKAGLGPLLQLVYVKVDDAEARFARMRLRDFATDFDTLPDFIAEDERLKRDFALAQTARLADVILWNNASLSDFYRQIETHIVPHILPAEQPWPL